MQPREHASPSPGEPARHRPRLEVADILRARGEEYLATHAVGPAELAVINAILRCRTAALGGHVDQCNRCEYAEISYNSCRNRHCPKCQAVAQAQWVEKRMERVLPTHAFHVVFTLPAELRALIFENRDRLFDLLFACAAESLQELGRDPRRLGAELGITSVLHTWTKELFFHPHVHCIVTGGGLSLDGTRWVRTKPSFLFPVRVIAKLFRGKFLDRLRAAHAGGKLVLAGAAAPLADPARFHRLCDKLYKKRWVVYSKPPFGGPEQVFRYLGRYTHRVGLSNYRLVSFDERGVTFRTRGDKTLTLTAEQFIGRFLLHVLPKGFVKIRHHGLMAPANVGAKLAHSRRLLEAGSPPGAPRLRGAADVPAAVPEATPPAKTTFDLVAILLAMAARATSPQPCRRCCVGMLVRMGIGVGLDAVPAPAEHARLDSS